ncbi:MAG: T9SS type A sorting domain-containing protein [Candidatus Kapabacteria bacterium]|nr:T9SS type A sorting domain-containing protein [Candidatus Kapabacteria bacterium]
MKMNCKMFLFIAVSVIIGMNPLWGQEPDPYLLWQTTDPEGYEAFLVHPNGNIIAMKGLRISELNGNTGEVIRVFNIKAPVGDISPDGKYLLILTDSVTIIDYETEAVLKKLRVPGSYPNLRFFPDGNRIIYCHQKALGTGLDSSLVVYNLIKDEYTYLDLNYSRPVIATSLDGKYFATGGTKTEKDIMGDDVFYTILTLWDAVTLKPIKELAKIGGNFEVRSIKFSQDGKYVGYQVYLRDFYVYKLDGMSLFKHYNESNVEYGVIYFCFLDYDLIGLSSGESFSKRNFMIMNLLNDKKVFYRHGKSGLLGYNPIHNSFLVRNEGIESYDLNKILTGLSEPIQQNAISVQYRKSTLFVTGLISISGQINISISDIKGKVVYTLNSPKIDSELRIPIKLLNGTYLIHIQDGKTEYSSKFLVTE